MTKRERSCEAICNRIQRAFPDYDIRFSRTGHPDWYHGYISQTPEGTKRPISVGRILFHRGEYSHIKFYGKHNVYLAFAVSWMISYNIIIKPKFWAVIWLHACAMADKRYNEKVDARSKLKPKKRPPLSHPNPINFVKLPDQYRTIIKG